MKKDKKIPPVIDEPVKKKKKKKPIVEEVPVKKKKKKKKKPKEEPEIAEPEETAAQKYARERAEEEEKKNREDRAFRLLRTFKHRDLKRECILRGLSFEEAVSMGAPSLAGWFTTHLDDGQDNNRLNEFDAWVDTKLEEKGHKKGDAIMNPSLKYGVIGKSEDWDNKPHKAPKIEKDKSAKDNQPKERRVKDDSGIYSGTKKSLTYELTKEGMDIDEIVEKVLEHFEDANEKSIRIWNKRCLKAMRDAD